MIWLGLLIIKTEQH